MRARLYIILQLKQSGHDVVSVAEAFPAEEDNAILARASAERRLLLTQDLDFGDLLFRDHRHSIAGIVLLRLKMRSADSMWRRLEAAIHEHGETMAGRFTVVGETRLRSRPLA